MRWANEILELSPTALRFLKMAFLADTDGLAGIQQLAGDATSLFYMSDEGKGGQERLPREAPAGLLEVPAPPLSSEVLA